MAQERGGESMSLRRLAPLSGVGFAVLAIAALGLWGDIIEPGQAAEEKGPLYVDDAGKVLAGAQLLGLAAFLLVWFGGSLRAAIARADGGDSRLASTAFGGAVAAGALMLASAAINGALALRADEIGTIDAEVAAVVGDVASVLGGAGAPIAMALTTAATAIVALRRRMLLPTWLAWVSVVLSVGLLAMPINYAVTIGFFGWTIVVGVLLYLREPAA